MRLLYINASGSGYADYIDVAERITVSDLFAERLPGARPQDFLIRVNRQPAAADQQLQENDRISFTPTKIEGALR